MEQINVRSRTIITLLVTGLLALSLTSGIKLGQDLEGGTSIRFSLDIDGAIRAGRLPNDVDKTQLVSDTIAVIDKRINAFGLANTSLLPVGEDKFEISLPVGSETSTESIIGIVTALGDLQFRIQVLPDSQYGDSEKRVRRGVWPGTDEQFDDYLKAEVERWKTARDDPDTYYQPSNPNMYVAKIEGREGNAVSDFMVLETPESSYDFTGKVLKNPRVGQADGGKPVVNFDIKLEFQGVFGEWTERNIKMPMAIVLNGDVTGDGAAPIIQSKLTDNVQVTLGSYSWEEGERKAKELATVLQTGSLQIRPTLESENKIGATLAGESRDRGILAIIVAFVMVLVFMVVYYRWAGLVADVALLLNLVLLVGFLAFFKAVLTLPGIAGIVLTIGMAVDANILINERIREERRLGRSVRRALSEGYGKALSAIVDANVTSLITAIFLYWMGSGPVRGFAITLAIGLVVSMFTAIYVTRTIFEWRLKHGGLQKLGTYGAQTPPRVNWVGMRRIFVPISVVGVVLGLTIFTMTDKYTLYDVDFTGGYKLQAEFATETSVDDVKDALAKAEPRSVKIRVKEYEGDDLVDKEKTLTVGPFPNAQVLAVGAEQRAVEIKVQRLFETVQKGIREADQAQAFEMYVQDVLSDRLVPPWILKGPGAYAHGGSTDEALAPLDGGVAATIAFRDPGGILTEDVLATLLRTKMPFVEMEGSKRLRKDPAGMTTLTRLVVVREATEGARGTARVFDVWLHSTQGDSAVERETGHVRSVLAEYLGSEAFRNHVNENLGRTPDAAALGGLGLSIPFPAQDQIGSSVAQRLKDDALKALFLALVGIIIYIAIRFSSRAMGFAAVLCLFHDVAITLGLVSIANTLGVVDAKINLAMVAAFLTLVGYSVNDTVVIFDRIREERGKRPRITPEIINLAINLCLARTIRTSITFLLVCLALFGFNFGQRNVLEGFAFLLIIGSVVGTYSTIAISSPLLLYLPWLWERIKGLAPNGAFVAKIASNPVTLLLAPIAGLLWLAWGAAFAVFAFVAGLALFIPWAVGQDAGSVEDGPVEPEPDTGALETA